jgi:hypothetical protein
MPKLTLHLDALRVDSFETSPTEGRRDGTVRGHADAFWAEAQEPVKTQVSVQGYASCDPDVFTCGDTCGDRCHTLPATCMTCTLDVCCPRPIGADGF